MREQDVDVADPALAETEAELPDPAAGVEDEQASVGERDLDARRVAAVPKRLAAGRRDRAAAPPDRDLHRLLAPEDRHDADELVRVREERNGGHRHLALDAV